MKEIAAFAGVDPDFYENFDFEHRNESVAIKSGMLHQIGLRIQPLIPHALQKRLLPLYMKINSGGRAPDDQGHAVVLSDFKKKWSHVGASIKSLFPSVPLEKWR